MHRASLLVFCAVITCKESVKVSSNLNKSCGLLLDENQFPWEASIFTKTDGENLQRQGVGSLISSQHVVALASTVSNSKSAAKKFEPFNANNVKLAFGKTQFSDNNHEGFVLNEVAKIVIHDEAKFDTPPVFNIAVIYLKGDIKFSDNILPVCLKNSMAENKNDERLVAFSISEIDASDEKNQTTDEKNCKIVLENLKNSTSHAYFCATDQEKIKYDDALYEKDIKTGKWFLSKMLNTVMHFDNNTLDTASPLFYEDVGKYSEWIQNQLKIEANFS
jgi:Trypsin